MSPKAKAKSAGKKAAATRKPRAAAKKAAATRKHRAAGKKAAQTRVRKAVAKKAAATRARKKQTAAAPLPTTTRTVGKVQITEAAPATRPAPSQAITEIETPPSAATVPGPEQSKS